MVQNNAVIFRVDGSSLIGLGHLKRSIALAQALEKKKIDSIFVTRNYQSKIKKLIQSDDYKVELIPSRATFFQDADLTLSLAQKHKANLIFTDLSNANVLSNLRSYGQYIKALKRAGKLLVSIDGFGSECIASRLRLPFDIIIVPYFGAEKQSYKVGKETKLLLGTDYFILRQEFIKNGREKRKIKKRGENILISLSIAVSPNLISQIKKALSKVGDPCLNYQIAFGLKDNRFVKLMQWADLAVLSSGLTKYEAAALGLPCIVIAHNKTHDIIMKQYAKSQTCLYLGEEKKLKQDDIIEEIKKILASDSLRKKMSLHGKKLVDGRGGERITRQIMRLMG